MVLSREYDMVNGSKECVRERERVRRYEGWPGGWVGGALVLEEVKRQPFPYNLTFFGNR